MARPGVRVIEDCWEDVDWTVFRHHFDAVYSDVFPFGATDGDTRLWWEIVRMILKPVSGVCVLYGTRWDLAAAREDLHRFFGAKATVHTEACQVHVPFVIPEWKHYGLGTHTIHIPWFTLAP